MRKANVSLTVLRKRLFAVLAAIAFLFCLFLGRFFYVQLVWERELLARAVDQWTRELPVAPERGNIFDASGELLAGNTAAYTLYARANAVKDAEKTARALSSLLPLSYESLLTKLSDRSSSEIVLLRRAEKETVAAVEGTNLQGVYYARDNRRVYPYGALSSQVLGFSSSDGAGLTGIEKQYESYLAGTKGEILYETDLVGVEIEGTGASYIPAEDGLDVTLTLDVRIQSLAEEVMARALEERPGRGGEKGVVPHPLRAVLRGVALGLPPVSVLELRHHDLGKAIRTAHVVGVAMREHDVDRPAAREGLRRGAHVADAHHRVHERRPARAHHQVRHEAHGVNEAPQAVLDLLGSDELGHAGIPSKKARRRDAGGPGVRLWETD